MPLLFHPEVLELPLKQEATLHGTVPHLLLYAMMQQAVPYVSLPLSAPIQERHLTRKTPLLRSMEAVNTQALRLIRLFGNHTS